VQRRLAEEEEHTETLTNLLRERHRPDYSQIRRALAAARALDPPLPGPLIDEGQALLDALPERAGEWLARRLGNDSAGAHLGAFTQSELQAFVSAIEAKAVHSACACANERHEPMRAVVSEIAAGADHLTAVAEVSAAELAERRDEERGLVGGTPGKREALEAADRAAQQAAEQEAAARAAHERSLQVKEAADLAAVFARTALEGHEAAVAEAAGATAQQHERHDHLVAIRQLVDELLEMKSTQLRGAEDRLGAANAVATFSPTELNHLLIELGVCCYIEPFAQRGIGPAQLKQSDAALQRLVSQ
jgi:hypothetical protein